MCQEDMMFKLFLVTSFLFYTTILVLWVSKFYGSGLSLTILGTWLSGYAILPPLLLTAWAQTLRKHLYLKIASLEVEISTNCKSKKQQEQQELKQIKYANWGIIGSMYVSGLLIFILMILQIVGVLQSPNPNAVKVMFTSGSELIFCLVFLCVMSYNPIMTPTTTKFTSKRFVDAEYIDDSEQPSEAKAIRRSFIWSSGICLFILVAYSIAYRYGVHTTIVDYISGGLDGFFLIIVAALAHKDLLLQK